MRTYVDLANELSEGKINIGKYTRIKVVFNNIGINTDYQLISGFVKTEYDPDWNSIIDLDEFIDNIGDLIDTIYDTLEDALEGLGILDGDYEEENIDFEIEDIVVNEEGETVIIGTNGEEQNLGAGNNTVVTDENGNVIVVNEDGDTGAISDDAEGSKETPYYVEVVGRTQKYKYKDKIYFVRQNTNDTLILKTTVDSLKFSNPKWKMGNVNLGEGDSISIDLKTLKNKRIDIVDTDDSSKKFRVKLKIYDKPVINIKKESGFAGFFGFDEAEETELQNNGDYNPQFTDSIFHKKFSINKTKKYFVKWITLIPNQTIDLKIDTTYIKSEMKKDPSFGIKFKTSSPNLTFEDSGTQELIYTYDGLEDSTLKISAAKDVKNDANFNKPYTITAYDQSNEVVGKINVVLGKIRNPKQEIVLVRVKHDNNGYANYNIGQAISLLNQEAYNQAFINWTNKVTDLLNIRKEYSNDPSRFNTSSNSARNNIKYIYKQNKVMNEKKYYVFVTDIRVTNSEGNVAGSALPNTNSLILLKDRGTKTIIHELGHCLGLEHTFPSDKVKGIKNFSHGNKVLKIPKGTTNSFMDYSYKRNMFFLFQLKHLFNYQFKNKKS